MHVDIRRPCPDDLPSFNATLNQICREGTYLGCSGGFSLETHRRFLARVLEMGYPQLVAVDAGGVVGWCDIVPRAEQWAVHIGRLGMGLLPGYRGLGFGGRLLGECLELARRFGLEKAELEVFADNPRAIRLYQRFGFVIEGQRRNARKRDGIYQDALQMALTL
ncbi:MAG: GNAT family N-acetyltransferase [Gammaproteobacteria bacterium]